jgi:hypothetical protein
MKISQREARQLRLRAQELEEQISKAHRHWLFDYPGGTHIGTLEMTNFLQTLGRVEGARICGHAIVCTTRGTSLLLYAVAQP